MTGSNLDVVQQPLIVVWVEPVEVQRVKRRRRLALLTSKQQLVFNNAMTTVRLIISRDHQVFSMHLSNTHCGNLGFSDVQVSKQREG